MFRKRWALNFAFLATGGESMKHVSDDDKSSSNMDYKRKSFQDEDIVNYLEEIRENQKIFNVINQRANTLNYVYNLHFFFIIKKFKNFNKFLGKIFVKYFFLILVI